MFFSKKKHQRHSRGGGNPEGLSTSTSVSYLPPTPRLRRAGWIPAFAGMTCKGEGGAQKGRFFLREVVLVVAGAFLLMLSAKVQVPSWPVPMTMQSLVVVALPMAMGTRAGFGAVLLYLMQGACGLPVFAGTPAQGIGLAYMAGPTGGFLIGFLASALTSGWLFQKIKNKSLAALVAASAGHAVLFLFGAAWLAQGLGWEKAVAVGVIPFIAGAVIKSLLPAAFLALKPKT